MRMGIFGGKLLRRLEEFEPSPMPLLSPGLGPAQEIALGKHPDQLAAIEYGKPLTSNRNISSAALRIESSGASEITPRVIKSATFIAILPPVGQHFAQPPAAAYETLGHSAST
jgi:hypothetical protein